MKKIVRHIIGVCEIRRVPCALSLLLTMLLLVACSNNRETSPQHEGEPTLIANDVYQISLTYFVGDKSHIKSTHSTRSIGTEAGDHDATIYEKDLLNENKIESVQLFIFDSYGEKIVAYGDAPQLRQRSDINAHNYKATIRIDNDTAEAISRKKVRIVLLTNVEYDYTRVDSYEELQYIVKGDSSLNKEEEPRSSFMMNGEREVEDIDWGDSKVYEIKDPIELKRALAKIRLRIKDISVVDFQNDQRTEYEVVGGEVDVKLVHYTPQSALLAGKPNPGDIFSNSDFRRAVLREYPGEPEKVYVIFPFYAAEHSWKAGDQTRATHMILRLRLRPKKTSNDPKGTSNDPKKTSDDPGKYYFYRIPISYRLPMEGVSEERLHRVERNYLYDVVTSIEQLGTIDEGEPFEQEAHVAIQPWNEEEKIDGAIVDAHYLVVKETFPTMANVEQYDVEFVSSLPVEVVITKAYYEYYNLEGDYVRVVFSGTDKSFKFYKDENEGEEYSEAEILSKKLIRPKEPQGAFDGAKVSWTEEKYLRGASLTIQHDIPTNYVPFHIELEVKQKAPGKLSEKIFVTQHPWAFVTARQSIGPRPTEGDKARGVYADFRHHTPFGDKKPDGHVQKNDKLNRISVKVPTKDFLIGDPVERDENSEYNGYTKRDETSNKIVSPEFIIASQYGMSLPVKQGKGEDSGIEPWFHRPEFSPGYGPYSHTMWEKKYPYVTYWDVTISPAVDMYRPYNNAEERCHGYFEDEYGTDGEYVEHYYTLRRDRDGRLVRNTYGQYILEQTSRTVYKTFKYQGRWRIPTAAEMKLIDDMQRDPKAVVKELMLGSYYWTAEEGYVYDYEARERKQNPGNVSVYVRCIFDTYTHDDKPSRENN